MWTWTAVALIVCLAGPFWCVLRGNLVNRLVALQAGGTLSVIVLLVIAEAFHRAPFVDLALALALLTFGAGLVFIRFLERWL